MDNLSKRIDYEMFFKTLSKFTTKVILLKLYYRPYSAQELIKVMRIDQAYLSRIMYDLYHVNMIHIIQHGREVSYEIDKGNEMLMLIVKQVIKEEQHEDTPQP